MLTEPECQQIVRGLSDIRAEIEEGCFEFVLEREDVHMHVEAALIDRLGLKQSPTEKVLGKAAEVAGRLNPVNLTRSKTQGMTQVELDILQGALQGQIGMWQALGRLAELVPDGGMDREGPYLRRRRV